MSQSNNSTSSQGALNNDKVLLAPRKDSSDWTSSTTEMLDQHRDVAQNDAKVSEPTSTEQVATSRKSLLSPSLDDKNVHNISGISTSAGTKETAYPCEPCGFKEPRCDGARPICNNCAMNGRRFFYEHLIGDLVRLFFPGQSMTPGN